MANLNLEKYDKYSVFFIYTALALAVLAVYWPVHSYDFINYDDSAFISENKNVTAGLTFSSIKWALTTGPPDYWRPAVWLSHIIDCELFGLDPSGHHLTNLLLHIANTLLLFGVLKAMTGSKWACAFAAACFGLHPMHVESVAWISERKDVLSAFFWFLTMMAYLRYVRRPSAGRYVLTLFLFEMGLMSKPMVVVLPLVLLLLDYWPLGRFTSMSQRIFYRLLREKIPFFILSVISGIITFIVQKNVGTMAAIDKLPPFLRAGNAAVSYMKYIAKTLWPNKLAVFYPHPGDKLPVWQIVMSAAMLLAVLIIIIRVSARHKYLMVGWLWYIGTLLPMIGLIQVGAQAMADRYSYIPLIGIFIMIAWSAEELCPKTKAGKTILTMTSAVIIIAMSVCSRLQVYHWENSLTINAHAVKVTDNNFIALSGYGEALCRAGKYDEGLEYLRKSVFIRPNYDTALYNMGLSYAQQGKYDQAIKYYNKVLQIKPDYAEAQQKIREALSEKDKTDKALQYFDEAKLLEDRQQKEQAIELYKKAVELKPNFIVAHGRLGLAMASVGRIDEAVEQFRIVLKDRPQDIEMHCNIGLLLARQDKAEEAAEHYRQALRIDPNCTKAKELLEAAVK